MTKGKRIISAILVGYAGMAFLHLWLNIGFERLGLGNSEHAAQTLRVGFLPVT